MEGVTESPDLEALMRAKGPSTHGFLVSLIFADYFVVENEF